MEKRVLIAVVLSFLVLYVYQAMFAPKPVPQPKAAQTELRRGLGGARRGPAVLARRPASVARRSYGSGRRTAAAAAAAAGRGRRGGRRPSTRHRHRDRRPPRRVHQPRRGAEELAAEALQGQSGQARRPRAPDAAGRGEAVPDRHRQRRRRRARQHGPVPRGRRRAPRATKRRAPTSSPSSIARPAAWPSARRSRSTRAASRSTPPSTPRWAARPPTSGRHGPEPGRRRDPENEPVHHGRAGDPLPRRQGRAPRRRRRCSRSP